MATILLTDDEYTAVKQLMDDMRTRIPQSSPRAATHFTLIATHCANFLAKEDGKRAQRQTHLSVREQLQEAKQARRSQAQAARSQGQPPTSSSQTSNPRSGTGNTTSA